jgi:hypothetical protein
MPVSSCVTCMICSNDLLTLLACNYPHGLCYEKQSPFYPNWLIAHGERSHQLSLLGTQVI